MHTRTARTRPRVLVAATALAAATLATSTALTASASAATRPMAVSPQACSTVANMDRDEHTGQLFATGYATCLVGAGTRMNVILWVDSTAARQHTQLCTYHTQCVTSTGSITPLSGRHRYCAEARFYLNSNSPPVAENWSCEYLG